MLFLVNTDFKKVAENFRNKNVYGKFITGVLVRGCLESIRKISGGLLSMFEFVRVS